MPRRKPPGWPDLMTAKRLRHRILLGAADKGTEGRVPRSSGSIGHRLRDR
jgi:hypothetical protein